jgi:phenylpyruvate tautomerase PptA (4-oxalocrotonate tautomerase family)
VIKGITDVLVRVLDKNPESTFVVIDEVPLENWGHRRLSPPAESGQDLRRRFAL